MANAPLTIRYTPEAKDYVRASRELAKNTTSFKIMAAILIVAMLVSLVILLVPSVGDQSWKNIALVFFIVGVFYVVYFFAIIPFQLKSAYKKNEHLQVQREFTLKDEGLGVKVGGEGTELKWENLSRVIDAKDFYLMVYKGTQKLYFFIPERAFDEHLTQEAFVDYLKAKSIPVN
jgi:hypothetical protein